MVDTSVWIEILRRAIPLNSRELPDFSTCAPIVQEVFQGLDDNPAGEFFRESLLAIPCLDDPLPIDAFLEAAEIYRHGRSKGYTIRSTVDCLIAAIAIRHGVAVWHRDRDFDSIARFTTLKTVRTPAVH